jgi:hypothetical protein
MRVDPLVPRGEKLVLVLEAIGDDKVRVNHQALDSPLDNQALEVVANGCTSCANSNLIEQKAVAM